jgi:hypothetical protein
LFAGNIRHQFPELPGVYAWVYKVYSSHTGREYAIVAYVGYTKDLYERIGK